MTVGTDPSRTYRMIHRYAVAALVLVATPMIKGCDSTPEPVSTSVEGYDPNFASACQQGCAVQIDYNEADVVRQPGAQIGDLTRCPISGVVFEVRADSPRVTHEGREYITCCAGCAAAFEQHPEKAVIPS